MDKDELKELIGGLGDKTVLAIDGQDISAYVDTGSYALNAQLSGSIWKGQPSGTCFALAGDEATGKTFFALSEVKSFLDKNPNGIVYYFESEGSVRKETLISRGIDINRVVFVPVFTIEEFRTKCSNVLNKIDKGLGKKYKFMCVLDSLGMLSTLKETGDIDSGKDKRDMTRSQLIRGAFRALRLKMTTLDVPFIVTNHTYAVVGAYVPTKDVAGGGGLKYAADTIVFLSKKKDTDAPKLTKEEKAIAKETGEKTAAANITGVLITSKLTKSRWSKENTKIELLLNYKSGLDRYYGLFPILVAGGKVVKKPKGYLWVDGSTVYEPTVKADPEKYYTKEVLDMVEEIVPKIFMYGQGDNDEIALPDEEEAE